MLALVATTVVQVIEETVKRDEIVYVKRVIIFVLVGQILERVPVEITPIVYLLVHFVEKFVLFVPFGLSVPLTFVD